MPWSISDLMGLLAALPMHLLSGDAKGVWTGIATLFLAIALVGGFLLSFLIRSARRDIPGSTDPLQSQEGTTK